MHQKKPLQCLSVCVCCFVQYAQFENIRKHQRSRASPIRIYSPRGECACVCVCFCVTSRLNIYIIAWLGAVRLRHVIAQSSRHMWTARRRGWGGCSLGYAMRVSASLGAASAMNWSFEIIPINCNQYWRVCLPSNAIPIYWPDAVFQRVCGLCT